MSKFLVIGDDKWRVVVFYVGEDPQLLRQCLEELHATKKQIQQAFDVLSSPNTGLTYSCERCKRSVVAIGRATSQGELINTIVHEAKHLQSAICEHYGIEEDTEQASYLIGFIVQQIYEDINGIK